MEDTQWQSLIKLGNDSFHQHQWSKAETYYSQAYDSLGVSYRNNPLCSETLMAWICACHNLSTLYESTEQLSLALKFLTVPHEYLLEVSKSKAADEDIKLIAINGLRFTLSPILMFAQKHPICEGCLDGLVAVDNSLKQSTPLLH
ncbi:hypothetical protein [Colwellia sp. E2M01]|uniref:hypothetical protein n=1 Tax=Colwellia sp. E2M01 TaxID=2841561 RepID=UPI001C07FF28|nr:hypothetical protein [Colwellia sp. E2M01]MBU2870596.1 hypothetical protein [Colwellia sp. E2M01]